MDNKKKFFDTPYDIFAPSRKQQTKDTVYLKNLETYRHYVNTEMQMLASMFNYKGLPVSIDINFMELCLINYGICAIVRLSDGSLYAGVPALLPPLDSYGWGTTVELITRNGEVVKSQKVGKDCAIIWNNNTRTSEFDLFRFAESFTNVEMSLRSIVRNSRKAPIPVAKDSKTKTAITEALNNASNGLSDATIINDVALPQQINGMTVDIPVLNLSDVKDVDRLQFLSKYHDDLLRRLATLYGHDMQTSGKMAQQSIDEIQGYDSYSMILPEVRLAERIKGISMVNDVFGLNASVDYSLPWRYNIYKQDNDDDGVEESNIEEDSENERSEDDD